jgi:hypothetical protein
MRLAQRNTAMVAAALAAAVLAVPAGAATSTGGVQYGSTPGDVGTSALHVRPQAMLGRTLHFRGVAMPGATVSVQRLDQHGGGWLTVATATADAQGDYVAAWRADHIGVLSIRAMEGPPGGAHASQAAAAVQVTVYRPVTATWYGPGFYGHRTACGEVLTHDLVGVAHRGLPCGRTVALYYRGRTILAPVVDRGPYGDRQAAYDLTAAAAQELGFATTDRVGAVSLPTG